MTSKLASLHAGLVARKGEATPALTNPMFSYVDAPRPAHEHIHKPAHEMVYGNDSNTERRVWPPAPRHAAANEIIRPVDRSAPAREIEPVQVALRAEVQTPSRSGVQAPLREGPQVPLRSEVISSPPKSEPEVEEDDHLHRHRFTFRLTQSQRRRLRLAAAIQDQSLQQVLSVALDNHLEGLCACSLKSCACMAAAESEQS